MENNLPDMLKTQVLIEALPYIQKFNNKKVVVKYGGSAMLDPNLQLNVIRDVALDFAPILIAFWRISSRFSHG